MRILFRDPDPGSGGGVSGVAKLLEAYCGRFPGDRLTVMCTAQSPLTSLARFSHADLELLPAGRGREFHRLAWAAHGIRRQLARGSYDLVWCMNVGAYIKTAVPQVLSIQNAYQVYPWRFARLHPASLPQVAALRWFFRRSLACADAAIVQTGLMREYVKAIPECPRHVAVLPKSVVSSPADAGRPLSPKLETALAGASAISLSGEAPYTALYVATRGPHKNHRLLAALMDIYRRRGIAARLVVTLDPAAWSAAAGPGAESLVRSGHVIPIGWVAKDQLPTLYARVDCCVMPSLLESLSSAHLEAMQWRKPQIAAGLPYARELCGDAALYADPGDALAWVVQMERLRTGAALRHYLVSRGAERLKAFPATWNDMAEGLRSILTQVVKDKVVKDKSTVALSADHPRRIA